MRKVLSFVLVLALVLGSFSMVFGASFNDMAGEKSSDAVNVLSGLGVVSGYPDGTFKPDRIVTRAEMAKLIVAALGLEKFATATTSRYPDMAAAAWAQGYVAYGTSLGFISGYPDGTFKPNQTVSYEEAASMIVRALGYTAEFLPGGWPAEWMIKANSLGLFKGVNLASGAAGANRGDIAIMLYNALDETIGYVDGDNKWVGDTDDTMLDRLGAKKWNNGDAFVLTNLDADNAVINVRELVGAYVTAYVNDDDEIIAAVEKSTFLTGEIKADGKFKAGDVSYSVTSTKFMNEDDDFALGFMNGELDGTTKTAIGSGKVTIAAKFTSSTLQEVYSVMKWDVKDHGEHGMFADADAEDIAEDQSLFGLDFVLDDDDKIDTSSFVLRGAASLSDIDEDNVVYVYEGHVSGKITKVEVGTAVVSGEVTRATATSFTIGGKAYDLVDVGQDNGGKPAAGDDVSAYLDYSGKIYFFDDIQGSVSSNYGIFLEAEDETGTGIFDKAGKVYMFLADGSDKTFEVKSVYDTNAGATASAMELTDWDYGTLVSYKVDSKGKITEIIDLYKADPDKPITKAGYFNGYAINTNAVIFLTDVSESSDPDDYSVTTLSKVLDTEPMVYGWDIKSNKIAAMLIGSDVVSGDEVYGVVTAQATNNSSAGYEVTMFIDGVKATYNTDEDTYSKSRLYEVTFSLNGDAILDLVPTTSAIKGTVATVGGMSISGNVITVTTTSGFSSNVNFEVKSYTFDADAVVYIHNADGTFVLGVLRDIIREAKTIEFYDVYNDDLIYDVVLIY